MVYRVPSMAEVDSLRGSNGFSAVSTFSGAGGSSLGLSMAGFRVLRAHEFVDAAARVYEANNPGVPVDRRDIRQVSAEDLLGSIGLARGGLDLLEGSPPCSPFSTAGSRHKGWGKVKEYSDTEQRSDDLFFEYARLVDGVEPRVFIAENVSGLVKGVSKGYFLEILAALKAAGRGYRVGVKLLDSRWLGVPQARQRVIFVGVRADLTDANGDPIEPCHPRPFGRPIALREALEGVSGPVEPKSRFYKSLMDEWHRLRPGEQSRKYFQFRRMSWGEVAPTIHAGCVVKAAAVHPDEPRWFSIAELKRICSFPDDFVLSGSYGQQGERLGRSVPPLMARAIGETVRDDILRRAV